MLAHGGASNGYCLWLEGGKPQFTVVAGGERTTVTGESSIAGQWTSVRADFDSGQLSLSIDGKVAAQALLKSPLERDPAEGMQIGTDLGSQVTGEARPKFTGEIESVRIYSGKAP